MAFFITFTNSMGTTTVDATPYATIADAIARFNALPKGYGVKYWVKDANGNIVASN